MARGFAWPMGPGRSSRTGLAVVTRGWSRTRRPSISPTSPGQRRSRRTRTSSRATAGSRHWTAGERDLRVTRRADVRGDRRGSAPASASNCRSTVVPVTKSFRELGIDLPNMLEGARAWTAGQHDLLRMAQDAAGQLRRGGAGARRARRRSLTAESAPTTSRSCGSGATSSRSPPSRCGRRRRRCLSGRGSIRCSMESVAGRSVRLFGEEPDRATETSRGALR